MSRVLTLKDPFGFIAFGSGKDLEELMIKDAQLLQLDFDTIRLATNDFSRDNQLGEGGFGAVYKVINLFSCLWSLFPEKSIYYVIKSLQNTEIFQYNLPWMQIKEIETMSLWMKRE